MPKPMLRMTAAIYLELEDGETQAEAESRMTELLEQQGVLLVAWSESEVIDCDDEDH